MDIIKFRNTNGKIQNNKNSKTKEYCYSVSSLNTNLHMFGKQELQLKTIFKKLACGHIHGLFAD